MEGTIRGTNTRANPHGFPQWRPSSRPRHKATLETRTQARPATTPTMPPRHRLARRLPSSLLQAATRTPYQGGLPPMSASPQHSPQSRVTGQTSTRTCCGCGKVPESTRTHKHRFHGFILRRLGRGATPPTTKKDLQRPCLGSSSRGIRAREAGRHHIHRVSRCLLLRRKRAPLRGRRQSP
jgi:hypothetical protein